MLLQLLLLSLSLSGWLLPVSLFRCIRTSLVVVEY